MMSRLRVWWLSATIRYAWLEGIGQLSVALIPIVVVVIYHYTASPLHTKGSDYAAGCAALPFSLALSWLIDRRAL